MRGLRHQSGQELDPPLAKTDNFTNFELSININPYSFKGSDHDSSQEGDPGASAEQLNNAGNEACKKKMLVLPKRKTKSNVEKSLDVVFDKFKQSSATEFERLVVSNNDDDFEN